MVLEGNKPVYTGGEYELNNLLTELNTKYTDRWPGYGDDVFDQKPEGSCLMIFMQVSRTRLMPVHCNRK